MATALPVLLPAHLVPSTSKNPLEWTPKGYMAEPVAPPLDDMKLQEQEMAAARQMIDGKLVKKTRPRRTVDYNGTLGRWNLLRKLRPNPTHVPFLRPSEPYIIDLLPPKAYPDNGSTSLCTKFVHTSTNKIRCPVNIVTWTPEGRRVLTGSTSGEFTLWNGLTFNFETILQAHDTAIHALEFTHSGAYLASADKTGTIKYFQPNMNNLTAWQGSQSQEAIRGLSFSPDDSRFATASDDSKVRIWSFEESREESTLEGHGWDVKCVQWHPTKGLLVSGSKDNQIKFWDPRTRQVLSTLHQHKGTVQALSWSPNGDMVASASRDQTVRVFDIRAMKEFRILKGHKKEVCSVTWHPVHPILTSGGSEGAILHWDLGAPEPKYDQISPPRATLSQAHDSNVWSMAFHPLGHLLVTASNDHTTRFWSRERPGDATSVFSGGGEKPPEGLNDEEGDEDMMVPGFGSGGQQWGVKDMDEEESRTASTGFVRAANQNMEWQQQGGVKEEGDIPGFGGSIPGFGDELPGLGAGASSSGYERNAGYDRGNNGGGGGGYDRNNNDRERDRGGYERNNNNNNSYDHNSGGGGHDRNSYERNGGGGNGHDRRSGGGGGGYDRDRRANNSVGARQGGPLPSQQDMMMSGGGVDEWGRELPAAPPPRWSGGGGGGGGGNDRRGGGRY